MAIRIDLLPRYVGLRRWFKRILVACLSLVGVFAVTLFLLYYREQLRLETLKENRDAYEKIAKAAEEAQADATKAEGDAKPFQDTVNFFIDAGRTGPERAALLDLVRRYIYKGAVVSSVDLSDGQNVKFAAMVRNPDEYAEFLNNLRRGTAPTGILFKDLPSGAGILGYPNRSGGGAGGGQAGQAGQPGQAGQAGGTPAGTSVNYQVFPESINASGGLREPVVIPSAPGEAAAAPAGGAEGGPAGAPPGAPPPAP